ncbi:PLP-dependent transferase [Pleurotus eryngii]|uniref:PLP-dependent transferase n=1 Tax=Pleurotus eryngii TaxID=5323 RepID=A0A9P5ZUR8_PLEER|nr:PLP-dependent transferase [Pleurotus eryngii]
MECSPFDPKIASGQPIPPVEHAISVSLPTWKDNLNYEDNKKRLVGALVRGYPRFIVHERIKTLGSLCVQRFGGSSKESCLLFPTQRIADDCQEFIERHSSLARPPHTFGWHISRALDLHVVIFPLETFPLAKQFWQHTGLGITTRYSNLCLQMLASETATYETPISATKTRGDVSFLEANCHYDLELDSDVEAKRALRLVIAGDFNTPDSVTARDPGGSRPSVSSEDVFLFPTGMAAIWNAHQLALNSYSHSKTICYGFLYTDTLKVLQKWGPGCHHLGRGLEPDIQELEDLLETLTAAAELSEPPVSALFTEFPSNPLLQSFNLSQLRSLADKFGFLIVVDDTIATAVNVDILPYADIVTMTSLSKFFSGYADVMGGSLVLNPQGRYYEALKTALQACYVDTFFSPDAICMELNSRDFEDRIRTTNSSTKYICDFLREPSLAGGCPAGSPVIRDVYYPKYITRELYDSFRRERGGYGGLFTLMFTKETASHAFYDTLSCCKGPSLGTAFTLSCPYTILAHSVELEWAARWGVEEGLVRVSVGVEPLDTLMEWFELALAAAESVP